MGDERLARWVAVAVMMLRTPVGRSSAASSANLRVVMGVVSAGLRTIVFPVASAGPIFHMAIISG